MLQCDLLPGPTPTPLLSLVVSDVRGALGEPVFWGAGGGAMAADARLDTEGE